MVDANYHGKLGIVLINNSDDDFPVQRDDCIAQLILENMATPTVEELDVLDKTVQRAFGFVSIGAHSGLGNNVDGQPRKNQSMNEGQSTLFKHQNSRRFNSLIRLEGNNKPHIISQTTMLGQ